MSVGTVLKYPGSKLSIARWIIDHFPVGYEKMTYLEPFAGSLSVFFNKERSAVETINDIDGNVVNLFRVIRNRPEELARLVEYTPWSREEYRLSYNKTGDELEDARRFLVRMWMAIGSKTSDITGWRNNIKAVNGNCAQWATKLPGNIVAIADRLKHQGNHLVQIENQDALTLIRRHKRNNVLVYADPPYVLSTRSKRIYAYEMTDADHVQLLEALLEHPGPVLLSAYDNPLYENTLTGGWSKVEKLANCEAGSVRLEVLWLNHVAAEGLAQQRLFDA